MNTDVQASLQQAAAEAIMESFMYAMETSLARMGSEWFLTPWGLRMLAELQEFNRTRAPDLQQTDYPNADIEDELLVKTIKIFWKPA